MATRTPLVFSDTAKMVEELPSSDDIGCARAGTPASSTNISGSSVACSFASALTLPMTCTGDVTSFAQATNLADGETGILWITRSTYSLPSDPPSGSYKGNWDVEGTCVRVVIQRIGSDYLWSADELEVVS